MKQLFIVTFCLLAGISVEAQTWEEWFQQDATARKYARQQLAGLKAQFKLVEKGYKITSQGLAAIQAIKKSNLGMHAIHFISFSRVNPAIEAWPLLQKIIQYQENILKGITKAQSFLSASEDWVGPDKSYLQNVLNKLRKETLNQEETFLTLVSPGKVTLSDDERFGQIESLFESVQQRYAFLQSFLEQTRLLTIQRHLEKTQTIQLRKNTGL